MGKTPRWIEYLKKIFLKNEMIDTILISQKIEVDTSKQSHWIIQTTKDFYGTNIKCMFNDPICRLTYYPLQKRLFVETSLPKLLYSKNHRMITNQGALQDALGKLKEIMEHKIKMETSDPMDYSVHKLDICWNFIVEDVDKYLNFFAALPLPYHGYPIVFQEKTVTWRSTTEGLKFYDKFLESGGDPETKNMLRMELRMMHQDHLRKELKKSEDYNVKISDFSFSYFREKLSFYLTSFFGSLKIEENKKNKRKNAVEEIADTRMKKDNFMKSCKDSKQLKILGFMEKIKNRQHTLLPKRTYYRYIKELRSINFGSDLQPLNLEKDFREKVLLK